MDELETGSGEGRGEPGGRGGKSGGRRGERARGAATQTQSRIFDKPLPHSLEAEMALLGSMILDPQVVSDVVTIINKPADFYTEAHAAIYSAIVTIYDTHQSGDLVQIQDYLRTQGVLEQVGGDQYLLQLAYSVPSAVNAPRYARIVAEKAKLRRLIEAADSIIYDALNAGQLGPEGAREVLDAAEAAVFEIAQEDQRSDPQRLADLLAMELQRLQAADGKAVSGLPTGYTDLDKLLSGLQPGEMIIIAARPSMGKTSLALNLAEQIARGGRTPWDHAPRGPDAPVGVFSLEMSKAAIVQRLLSAFSGVDSHKIRTGHLSAQELNSLDIHAEGLKEIPLYIDDTPGLSLLALRARARRMVAQHGVKCLMIDYLQLLTAPGAARESRQVEVSAISRGIKALARELNVPVICLSQLNRASENREGNRPRMSDLRESGSIEQDADVVILLHREEYYHIQNPDWAMENPDKVGVAELIIAKQRNGPTGTVDLTWDAKTTRFKNHAGYSGGGGGGWDMGPSQRPAAAPAFATAAHAAPSASADPWDAPFSAPAPRPAAQPSHDGAPPPFTGGSFHPGRKTGPVADFRDGGGPDRDADDDDLDGLPI